MTSIVNDNVSKIVM